MEEAKKERRQYTEKQLVQTNELLDEVIRKLRNTAYGSYLLDKFPVRRVSATYYPNVYAELQKSGSPMATDGKEVFVDTTLLADMLVQDYPKLVQNKYTAHSYEDLWGALDLDNSNSASLLVGDKLAEGWASDEIRDMLLHELTHATQDHVGQSAAAQARGASPEYMTKLQIAHEIQANDGMLGHVYPRNLLQRQKGVTNKRLHRETIGCHTIRQIMDKLVLNEQEQMMAANKAMRQLANANERVAKATGRYQEVYQQAKDKAEQEEREGKRVPGKGEPTPHEVEGDESNDANIANELCEVGMAKVKKLLLEALSDQLRYDPASDSVFFDETIRRVPRRTYARPSRRQTIGSNILKKGVVYDRIHEPNKANKLTILAVDASGSMSGQQRYVSAILDDLLKQAEALAKQHNLEVHYENLLCTKHTSRATKLVQATSAEWKYMMDNYVANGDNDFDCVLGAASPAIRQHDYDAITIVNLSDGFDELDNPDSYTQAVRDAIDNKKLRWVDALVLDTADDIERADAYRRCDAVDIREQVVLNVRYKDNH